MRRLALVLTVGLLAGAGYSGSAEAKGCIKGAVVGGVAGHVAGRHGKLGAAAGCAVGMHDAHKQIKQQRQMQQAGTPPHH